MDNIKVEIENLLNQNRTNFEIAKVLKKDIKNYYSMLEETFSTSGGKDFLVKHTKKIDNLVKLVYKIAHREMFGDYAPMKNSIPLALVALGSYGREQLSVYSDIDLMIVYQDIAGYNTKDMIEKILYILWDTGVKLGHRVHKVEELFEVSKSDITIKTALIESRFIEGSSFIWTRTQNAITKIRLDNPEEFIRLKLQEQKLQHQKYQLTMEPNLKDGVGGFRDANLVYWIGKVLFNTNNIKNLPLDVVSDKEYRDFRMAMEFLFRVRVALHLVAGKKEDKLRLEFIPHLSKLLGYDRAKNGDMKFTIKVIGSLKIIRLYSIIWLDTLTRGYIEDNKTLIYPSLDIQDVNGLLKELVDSANLPFEIHPTFLQKIIHAKRADKLTNAYYKTIRSIFYKPHSYSVLNTLSCGMLLRYIIPPIKKVVDLPQFDGYHQYAVDIHSLKSLEYLENIKDKFIQNLFDELNSDEKAMIKLVTFLHDAGKGRHRDHHSIGASLFKIFAKKLLIKDELIKMGEILIQNHTLMSNVAQREDLSNEKTILKFASYFKTKKLLDLIYILTYSDMNGVGNSVYNSFNSKLIKTLYIQSIESLEHKVALDNTQKRVKKEKSLKLNSLFLELKKTQQKKILQIPSNYLFLRYDIEKIISISKEAFNVDNYIFNISNTNHLTIEITRKKSINLGYLLAKLANLEVVNMDIFKLFDDKKYFRIDFIDKVTKDELKDIKYIIENSFIISKRGILKKPIIEKKDITIDFNHSKSYVAFYLNSKNQKGLLAYIIDIFEALNIDIATAKIHTIKNRVRDIFLIEKNENFCDNKDMIIDKFIGI